MNKSLSFTSLLSLITLVFSTTAVSQQILVESSIYQIQMDVSGETTLTIRESVSGRDGLIIFSKAQLKFHDLEANLNEDEWIIPEHPAITLSNPKIVTPSGSKFSFSMASEDVEYFEYQDDGCYKLRELDTKPGIDLEGYLKAEEHEKNFIDINLSLISRTIIGREALKGVKTKHFGKPILDEQHIKIETSLLKDKNFGCMVNSGNRGILLLRLKLSYFE